MATYTNNYALIKPSAGEPASRVPLNTNFDSIDDIMHDNAVAIRDAEAMIAPAFNTATAYEIGDKVTYNHHLYIELDYIKLDYIRLLKRLCFWEKMSSIYFQNSAVRRRLEWK